MACGSAQPQEVSTARQNIMFLSETQLLFHVVGVIGQTVSQNISERDEADILKTRHIWVALFL